MQDNKDYIEKIEGAERRFVTENVHYQTRAEGEDNQEQSVIEGYAFKFNKTTTIGDWFREEILPGAADDVMLDDVRCLFNHNPNYVLARSIEGKGTLKLELDEVGLKYSYTTPDTSYARDLEENIKLGNVSQSSFGFTIEEQNWVERDGELPLRQIVKLKRLYDVSPVTYPAYQDTSVAKRSLESYQSSCKKEEETTGEKRETLSVFEAQVLINKSEI